jgi:hypothetical protein
VKTKVFIIVFLLLWQIGSAQTDTTKHTSRYYNTFFSGALIGCGDCIYANDLTFSFVTFHGIAFVSGSKLSAGAGIDVYSNWQMFPLLLAYTIDREKRSNAMYFHINSGYAFGRFLEVDPDNASGFSQRGGFIINPMIGYRMGNDRIRLYVQAGYKFQKASAMWGWVPTSFSREYDLNRLVVQLGFGFN